MEEWRPAPGYEGLYEVSDLGRVRRVKAARGTRAGYVLSTPPNSDGYPGCSLYDGEGRRRSVKVHQLVARAFLGPQTPGTEVNHCDGDPAGNRPGNLEYVTHAGNVLHGFRSNGRAPVRNAGEKNGNAKLSAGDVAAIRERAGGGESHTSIARDYPVARQTVSKAVSGDRW